MTDPREFSAAELIGLLPGGWTLADADQPGTWEDSGKRWRARLVDGADVARDLVVDADAMARFGRTEAIRRELDRVYRKIGGRGLFG